MLPTERAFRAFAVRARQQRWNAFEHRFPNLQNYRVLDLGGVPDDWANPPVRPARVVTVNLDKRHEIHGDRVQGVVGDACDLPAEVLAEQFDLVYSNALLEHVGGHLDRVALATVVQRMAPRHWIQTPYRYFPIEPHYLIPGLQFLPLAARVRIAHRIYYGTAGRSRSLPDTLDEVASIELVSLTEMRRYFPHSEIWRERAMGLTKSIVAVQQA